MPVVEFEPKEKALIKKHLSRYGNTKDCAEKVGVHRNTVNRIKKTGEVDEAIALKVREYMHKLYPSNFSSPTAA